MKRAGQSFGGLKSISADNIQAALRNCRLAHTAVVTRYCRARATEPALAVRGLRDG